VIWVISQGRNNKKVKGNTKKIQRMDSRLRGNDKENIGE